MSTKILCFHMQRGDTFGYWHSSHSKDIIQTSQRGPEAASTNLFKHQIPATPGVERLFVMSLVFVNSLTWNFNNVNVYPSTPTFPPHYSMLQLSAESTIITAQIIQEETSKDDTCNTRHHCQTSLCLLIRKHLLNIRSSSLFLKQLDVYLDAFLPESSHVRKPGKSFWKKLYSSAEWMNSVVSYRVNQKS